MPFDLSAVNWTYVGLLAVCAFVTALIGSLIAFRNRFVGAIIAGILFGVAYVFWTYYPHPSLPGPISPGPITPMVTTPAPPTPTAAAPPPAPSSPVTTLPATPAPASPAPAAPAQSQH